VWVVLSLLAVVLVYFLASAGGTALTAYRLFSLRPHDVDRIDFARASLQSDRALVRRAAARGLGRIGPEAKVVAPDLLAALGDDRWEVASDAAWSLGQIRSPTPDVIDGLIGALEHPHGEVKRYAAFSLGEYGQSSRSAVPKLTQLLGDEHMGYMAARVLGMIGPDARVAISDLTDLLKSPNWAKRVEATAALTKLAPLPRNTVVAIEELLYDRHPMVRDVARKTLGQIRSSQN
jgi:hypothetical protein